MGSVSIHQMADRVSALLGEAYGVKGDLMGRIAHARRRVPAKVLGALDLLASASFMAQNPRLAPQIDTEAVAQAYDLALKHLKTVDVKDRRKGMVLGIAGSIAFSLLVVVAGLVAVLHWRGFL